MSLDRLSELAHEQHDAETALTKAEALVVKRKAELKHISEGLVPELMDEMGMEDFTTSDGLAITVVENIRASIPKAKLPEGVQWLRDHGHRHLVKRAITVLADSDEQGDEILAKVRDYEPGDKISVNAQSLSAFVREMLREGEEIPMDLLGVFRQRVSKVKVK